MCCFRGAFLENPMCPCEERSVFHMLVNMLSIFDNMCLIFFDNCPISVQHIYVHRIYVQQIYIHHLYIQLEYIYIYSGYTYVNIFVYVYVSI